MIDDGPINLGFADSLSEFVRLHYRDSYMDYTRRRKIQIVCKRNQSVHMIRNKDPIYNDFLSLKMTLYYLQYTLCPEKETNVFFCNIFYKTQKIPMKFGIYR